MKNYKNGGLRFDSEASITPGTIVLIGSENRAGDNAGQENQPKILDCQRVRISGCERRRSAQRRFGFEVEPIESSKNNESQSPGWDAESAAKPQSKFRGPERRKHVRRPYYRFVYFLCDEKYYEGVTKDISSGGLFIRTRGKLTVGTTLLLTIPKNPLEKERTIQAEVVRVKSGGIGVKILDILKTKAGGDTA